MIHVTGSLSGAGDFAAAVRDLCSLALGGAAPTVLHVHLGSHDVVPAALYPANRAFVPQGPTRDLFDVAKPLPDALAGILRQKGVVVHPTARSMMYNGRMIDLRRLCDAVVDTLAQAGATGVPLPTGRSPLRQARRVSPRPPNPAPGLCQGRRCLRTVLSLLPLTQPIWRCRRQTLRTAPQSAPARPETPGLVVFVIDRSVEDLTATGRRNACIEISHCLAETIGWLGQVEKRLSMWRS